MHHVRHFTSKDLIHVNICIILPKVLKSVFVDYDIIFTILAQTAVNICLCITQSHSNWKLSEPLQNGRNITVTRNLGTSRTRTKMFWAFFFFFHRLYSITGSTFIQTAVNHNGRISRHKRGGRVSMAAATLSEGREGCGLHRAM